MLNVYFWIPNRLFDVYLWIVLSKWASLYVLSNKLIWLFDWNNHNKVVWVSGFEIFQQTKTAFPLSSHSFSRIWLLIYHTWKKTIDLQRQLIFSFLMLITENGMLKMHAPLRHLLHIEKIPHREKSVISHTLVFVVIQIQRNSHFKFCGKQGLIKVM